MAEKFQYGGQAVLEGVMMRGPLDLAIAVRNPKNEIIIEKRRVPAYMSGKPFTKWPVLRGFLSFIEMLIIGIQALSFSANVALEEEGGEEISPWEMGLTIGLATLMGVVLFVAIPTGLAYLLRDQLNLFWQNLVEGAVRLLLFLGYVVLISLMKDIQRVFQYHGAEHKVVLAYEAGEELTVENAARYSTLHPRCGTAFLLIVMIISIFVFSFLSTDNIWWRVGSRILLLPLVAGLSYEVLKFSGRHYRNPIVALFVAPGLWLQRLTTREPDGTQIEVAIAALKQVLKAPA
jgi:uncharacterized protein YqhQ